MPIHFSIREPVDAPEWVKMAEVYCNGQLLSHCAAADEAAGTARVSVLTKDRDGKVRPLFDPGRREWVCRGDHYGQDRNTASAMNRRNLLGAICASPLLTGKQAVVPALPSNFTALPIAGMVGTLAPMTGLALRPTFGFPHFKYDDDGNRVRRNRLRAEVRERRPHRRR